MKKFLFLFSFFLLAVSNIYAGEQTILITSSDASGVYYTSKGGVKMEMSGGMNNEGFMVQRHYDQINFRSYNFKIKKIVFRCLDNSVEGDNDSFYWGPTTMYIAPNTSVNNVVAGTLTTPYNNSTYMAEWVSSPTYADGLPIGQQLTIKCQGHPVRFAYIEITIDKEDGDMYELVTNSSQIVTGDKTYMLVHRLNSSSETGDALSSNQQNESTSGHFLSTSVNLYNNGFLARASGDVMFLRFSESNNSSYPYYIIAGGAYFRTESTQATLGSGDNTYTAYRLSRTNGMTLPQNTDYALASLGINSSTTGGTNGFDWYALMAYKGISGHRIRHYNGASQFRNIQNNNSYVAQQRVFLYKPAQKYEVFTATDGHGTITLRDGIVVDGTHNYSQMMDNVTFIVAPAAGYKIKNVTITNLTDNTLITPTVTTTTLGQNYAFSMPGSNVSVYAEFEEVVYHNINMVVKPSAACGNIFLTDGYVVQNDNVMSFEGEDVAFNVTANYIDLLDESQGKYELSYVSVTNNTTHQETILAASEVGKYNFNMPDADVTITAYFFDNVITPLYLLGTANGNETWHTYGPRFNYNDETKEYYIDVYFKGTGDFGTNTGDDWGEFRVTWLVDPNDNWDNIKGQGKQGHPYKLSVDPLTNKVVCQNDGKYRLGNGQEYGLNYEYGSTEYYGEYTDQEDYKFTLDPGIYRIYVGTQASQDAGGLGLNVLKAVKYPTALTLDPMGGAEAASAVEVPQNQLVTLEGDIYNKIKAINPQEADANFKYKAVKIIGENVTTDEPVASTTTATTTLTEVNDGETVTELHGYNYLGWIVAGDTAFYKVIYTPLKWIEEEGTPGTKYTVGDELIIMHKIDRVGQRLLWAKDQSSSVQDPYNNPTHKDATYKTAEQADYLDATLHVQAPGWGGWDQSNWVMLRFDENTDMTDYHVYQTINAGTLKGTYVDAENFCINVESMETGGDVGYVPNTFCPANFLDFNLNLDGEGGAVSPSGRKFFFLNPKVQEVADVTLAVWDKTNSRFIMPSGNGANQAGIVGYFTVNCLYNKDGDVIENLVDKTMYSFRGVLNVAPGGSNLAKDAPTGPDATKVVMPFDLNDQSVITAISDVMGSKAVSSVKYYNIMGVESNKPFDGVNIVVTRYSDGTISTTKVLR